jgi:gluconolactonase
VRRGTLLCLAVLAWSSAGCRGEAAEREREHEPAPAEPDLVPETEPVPEAEPVPDPGPEPPSAAVEIFAEPEARPLVDQRAFTEGPSWHPDGYLLLTDIHHDRVLRYRPGAASYETVIAASGRAAGTALDDDGRLVVCEGHEHGPGGRALARWQLDTLTRTAIVERYQGKRFNSPNDLVIDSRGRIYFSDPHYYEDPEGEIVELDDEAVYRVGPAGAELVRVIGGDALARPNGVALSPDERTLYVTDTRKGGPSLLYAFALDEQGLATGERETLYDFGYGYGRGRGGDGMCVDAAGHLFVAAGPHRPPGADAEVAPGLQVFDVSGKLVARLAVDDDMLTNCTHGGPDGRTLYMTGVRHLWAIATREPGAGHGPGR